MTAVAITLRSIDPWATIAAPRAWCQRPARAVSMSALRDESDESLMARYQGGEVRAFEVLLARHRGPVYNFLYRFVNNQAAAEDLLQEVFLRVIKGADGYQRNAKFTTWVYTIARNLCVDASRRAKHRRALSLDQPLNRDDGEDSAVLGDAVADKGAAVDRQAIGHELRGRIERAVARLVDEQREVFVMREILNLPFKEIADITAVSENTVKSRMRYALEKLRDELQEYADLAQAVQP
jgi:RNA polymerase sigma-70 factor (ECF subfamily)